MPEVAAAATQPALIHAALGDRTLGDSGPSEQAGLGVIGTNAAALDAQGNYYVLNSTRVRRVAVGTHTVTTILGDVAARGVPVDGAPAAGSLVGAGGQIALDPTGHLLFWDPNGDVMAVRDDGTLHRLATRRVPAAGLASAPDGSVYTSGGNQVIRHATDGSSSVVAGTAPGATPSTCMECAATSTTLTPARISMAPDRSLYVVDAATASLDRVDANGVIHRVLTGSPDKASSSAPPADGTPAATATVDVRDVSVAPSGDVVFVTPTSAGSRVYLLRSSDATLHALGAGTGACVAGATSVLCGGWLLPLDGTAGPAGQGTPLFAAGDQAPDGTPSSRAWFTGMNDLIKAADGSWVVAASAQLRKVIPGGSVSTLASLPAGAGGFDEVVQASDGSFVLLATRTVLRVPAAGGTPVAATLAPSTPALYLPHGLLPLADGRVLVGSPDQTYQLAPDNTLSTFAAHGSPLAYDSRDGSVVVAGGSYRPGTERVAVNGSTIPLLRTAADAEGADGTFVYRWDMQTLEERHSDGTAATFAGGLPDASGRHVDEVPAVGAAFYTQRVHRLADGSTLILDQDGLSRRARLVDAAAPPAAPAVAAGLSATSPEPGILRVHLPPTPAGQFECLLIRKDGLQPSPDFLSYDPYRPLTGDVFSGDPSAPRADYLDHMPPESAFCTGQTLLSGQRVTPTSDGGADLSLGVLHFALTPNAAIAGHYVVAVVPWRPLDATQSAVQGVRVGSRGLPSTFAVDVAPDTGPAEPVASVGLVRTTSSAPGSAGLDDVHARVALPVGDLDFDHVTVRYALGTTPPPDATSGFEMAASPTANCGQPGWIVSGVSPSQAIAVSAFALDVAGNASTATSAISPGAAANAGPAPATDPACPSPAPAPSPSPTPSPSPSPTPSPAPAPQPFRGTQAPPLTAARDGQVISLFWSDPPGRYWRYKIRRAVGATPPASITDGLAFYDGTHPQVTIGNVPVSSDMSFSLFATQSPTDLDWGPPSSIYVPAVTLAPVGVQPNGFATARISATRSAFSRAFVEQQVGRRPWAVAGRCALDRSGRCVVRFKAARGSSRIRAVLVAGGARVATRPVAIRRRR